MKKTIAILLVLALALTALTAQGAQEEKKDEIKVALIVADTVDDKGWCQAMHDGIVEAMAEMPGKIADYKAVENTQPADTMTAIRTYVNLGYNIIIVHGSQYRAQVEDAAKEFPDVMFAFGTTSDIIADNVFSYMPQSEETGFLSGIVAGLTTKKDKVALVGPIDGGDSARYNRGFVYRVSTQTQRSRSHTSDPSATQSSLAKLQWLSSRVELTSLQVLHSRLSVLSEQLQTSQTMRSGGLDRISHRSPSRKATSVSQLLHTTTRLS